MTTVAPSGSDSRGRRRQGERASEGRAGALMPVRRERNHGFVSRGPPGGGCILASRHCGRGAHRGQAAPTPAVAGRDPGIERTAASPGHAARYVLPAVVIAAGWADELRRPHGAVVRRRSAEPSPSPGRPRRIWRRCAGGSPTPCWPSPPATSRRRDGRKRQAVPDRVGKARRATRASTVGRRRRRTALLGWPTAARGHRSLARSRA